MQQVMLPLPLAMEATKKGCWLVQQMGMVVL